jgi:hypothetical protein
MKPGCGWGAIANIDTNLLTTWSTKMAKTGLRVEIVDPRENPFPAFERKQTRSAILYSTQMGERSLRQTDENISQKPQFSLVVIA